MASKGISDAQAMKETLFQPEPDDSSDECCTVQSMEHGDNGDVTITISVPADEARQYNVGQKLNLTPMDDSESDSSDAGIGA